MEQVVRSKEEIRDHVEWHSNGKDTPILPPYRYNRKNQKQLKLSGDIPELVSKGQQSLTTNTFYFLIGVHFRIESGNYRLRLHYQIHPKQNQLDF